MPALPSSVLEPLWVQVAALLPTRQVSHPLGCHRPRIPDRIVFDNLIQVLVFGCGYRRIADSTCSATTLRRRRDEWITTGVAEQLRLAVLAAYDRLFGLRLGFHYRLTLRLEARAYTFFEPDRFVAQEEFSAGLTVFF